MFKPGDIAVLSAAFRDSNGNAHIMEDTNRYCVIIRKIKQADYGENLYDDFYEVYDLKQSTRVTVPDILLRKCEKRNEK